jgi:hypothetical protein
VLEKEAEGAREGNISVDAQSVSVICTKSRLELLRSVLDALPSGAPGRIVKKCPLVHILSI